jgi:hypothetical protein
MLRLIYSASNSSVIGNAELAARFNTWAAPSAIHRLRRSRRRRPRHGANRIKAMITEETLTVEKKHLGAFELRNRANFLFLSNSRLPLWMASSPGSEAWVLPCSRLVLQNLSEAKPIGLSH